MDVLCKCGYEGDQFVQYETETPLKQLVDYTYGYRRAIKNLTETTVTLNWACPQCSRILVQQRGGLSYNQHELDDMRRRLMRHNYDVKWGKK
jgi:DNA-directed RNA polymerase subunit RPC12/RpoP